MPRPYPLRPARTAQGLARARAGLSLRQVEAATGVNRGQLSLWERGRLLLTPEQVDAVYALYEERSR